MRVLHIGWAFRPFRGGGLIYYVDDIMSLEHEQGLDVAYFCAGRFHPWKKMPRLTQWCRDGIQIFEIMDPPLLHAGDNGNFPAEYELSEPVSEAYFTEVLDSFRPDLIHIHEMAGLPFSLIDIASEIYELPILMTLHNYFMLCPTLNLFRPDGTLCLTDNPSNDCPSCHYNGDDFLAHLVEKTLDFERKNYQTLLYKFSRLFNFSSRPKLRPPTDPQIFAERLRKNINYLRKINVIVSQSHRTSEIYRSRTGRDDILVLHSSLPHIEAIRPQIKHKRPHKICFATLNGCLAPFKGAGIIAGAVDLLKKRGLDGCYKLEIWGDVHESVKSALAASSSVVVKGKYSADALNNILSTVDVGIIPSLCEEVFGYVGIEFIAKGIPVIGNRRGGITDYVIDGCTGWINYDCTYESLADLMEKIIRNPKLIIPLNNWICANRNSIIANRSSHVETLISLYNNMLISKD